MPNERDFVLHSWCVPGDWNAPTVVGGHGAKLHPGRRPRDPRHVEPRRVQQPRPPAPEAGRRHQGTGRQARLRDRGLGCRVPPGPGRAPARGVRLRGRARVLHAGRRRCQRKCRAHRAACLSKAARPHRHARPLLSRRDLHADGALGRFAHRAPGGRRGLGRAPRAAALRLPLPLRQHDRRGMRPPRSRRRRVPPSTRRARAASPPS